MEDIVKMESQPNAKARVESEKWNVVWKFEFIKLLIISLVIGLKFY